MSHTVESMSVLPQLGPPRAQCWNPKTAPESRLTGRLAKLGLPGVVLSALGAPLSKAKASAFPPLLEPGHVLG